MLPIGTISGRMKHNPALAISQNSNLASASGRVSRHSQLPPTYRQVIAGVEMHQAPGNGSLSSELFGKSVRHYRMTARAISAQTVTLETLTSAEIEGAVRLLCERSDIIKIFGIATPTNGTTFKVLRRADLFPGGSIDTLEPGVYVAGDTVACEKLRRIYLELHHGNTTSVAVVGVFMHGHLSACVDWRVTVPRS